MIPVSFDEFTDFCRENAFSFCLDFSEASDSFDLHVFGAGQGEDYYCKKQRSLWHAIERIKEQIADRRSE